MGKVANLVKFSQALARVICDNVEDGITVAEQCKKNPELPTERTIYRWKKQYPEFSKQLFESYQIFFMKKIDEIEELSSAPLPTDMDKIQLNAELNRRRIRIDALKFILAKIAPKMVPELRDVPTTAVAVMPQIQIVKYQELIDVTPK